MKLKDLILKIQERNLSKDQLEAYRDQLSELFALMNLEMAEILKAKALFIDTYEAPTDIAKKRKWQASLKGLREIELKSYMSATKEMLSSLRNRLYNYY